MRNPALKRVRVLGPNMTEIEHGDLSILYSYETPVAVFVEGAGYLKTDKFWSNTTSRHISKWAGARVTKSVPQEIINHLAEFADPEDIQVAEAIGRHRGNPRVGTRSGRIRQLVHEGFPDGHGQAGAIAYREWREGKVSENPGDITMYAHPGKYEGEAVAAEVLHHLIGEWGDQGIGDVTEMGWYATPAQDFTQDVLDRWREQADEYDGPPTAADVRFVKRYKYAIVVEDSQGFVTVRWFANKREFEQEVRAYEREAEEWYAGQEEE
jgi:hypothetical protein